jgi:predicted DNA-binding protein (MmcQ/YjbR family)
MTREAIRAYCISLPHVTEKFVMHHAGFQIGGKTFAMLNPEVEGLPLAFKCSPDDLGELVEIPGVMQAPYMAKRQRVAITEFDALAAGELKARLVKSRALVPGNLSKKKQTELA